MNKKEKELPRGVFETSPGSCRFGIRITDAYGNRREKVIGTRAEAVIAAKEARNERRRIKVLEPERPRPTFREIADLGIAYAKRNHSEPEDMEARIKSFCAEFGHRIAEEISTTEIQNWLKSKAAERDWSDNEWAVNTMRKYRSAIRICYKEAIRLQLAVADPTELIVYHRVRQKKIRNITPEELARLRQAISIPGNHRRPPGFCRKCLAQLEIARQTGMRKSEQFGATWENIDWLRHVLFIPKSKNTHPRDVYLNSYVIAILRALQAEQTRNGIPPGGTIFGISNPSKWFDTTLKFAQIQGVTWHTLRHNFATQLVSANVPIKHVQDLMGQIDWESTVRYIHPPNRDVRAALASIVDTKDPEYLANSAYIEKVLCDEAYSAAARLRDTQSGSVGARQDSIELPANEVMHAPRMLSRIPRQELYEQVWSAPMIHVARHLGRSDVAVAKTCRKRNIPVPPQGYWNRIAAGKPVPPRPPLPPM